MLLNVLLFFIKKNTLIIVLSLFISINKSNFAISSIENINNNEKRIFSSYIVNNNKNHGNLLVIYENKTFIRTINGEKFAYYIPQDDCYKIETGASICTHNGLIYNIIGEHNNINTTQLLSNNKIDMFYNEKNNVCNEMKFDVIYRFLIKNETIKYSIYQLYILNYFDVLRLVIFDDTTETNENNRIKAFIISSKNDVSCSNYNSYILHQYNNNDNTAQQTNNTSSIKRISKKTIEIENYNKIYKYLALKKYTHLEPLSNLKKYNDAIITIEQNIVKKINLVMLDFHWKEQTGNFLLNMPQFDNINKTTNI